MLAGKSPEQVKDMKLKEIKHCRLAMLASIGIVAQTLSGVGLVPGSQ